MVLCGDKKLTTEDAVQLEPQLRRAEHEYVAPRLV